MATNNQFISRLSQLREFQRSQDHPNIINTLTPVFDSDANDIIKKWTSSETLSADEKKYIDSYSIVQLSFVKYCLFYANTTANVQPLIERIQGHLFQRTQVDTLARAVEFIRDQESSDSNDAETDDLMLVCIMRMIDARSLVYRLCSKDIAIRPRKLNDELNDCLLHRPAKKCLYDAISISKTKENILINDRHQFFIGCCTFAVALYDENKEKLTNNESNNKYIYLLAKYVRVMLNEKHFADNKSTHYCLRGVLALLTNCIPHQHWLNIMNQALANENDEDAQRKNPLNLDLFSSIVNKLLASNTLQNKSKESDLNDETLLVDAALVFLVKWSHTQKDRDDDEEEDGNNNNNSSLPSHQPNELLRCFQSHEYFPKIAQRIAAYVDAKYDRVRLMALSLLSNIMNYQDFQDLGQQKPHMAADLVKLIFDFLDQAAKQPDYRYKGIPFDTLLIYLHRFLVQDFIKRETLVYLSRLVDYAKRQHSYALKILRRMSTSPALFSDLSKDPRLKQFLDTDADILYSVNEKMSKIIRDIRQNLAPPPLKVTKSSVSGNENDCKAFISYCHDDKVKCKLVQEKLEEAGLFQKIWVDTYYMKDNMIDAVTRGINESKVVFVLLSDAYCKSDFARREWTYAIAEKIKIYVIVVQEDFDRKNYDWVRFQIGTDMFYKMHRNDALQNLIEHVRMYLNGN